MGQVKFGQNTFSVAEFPDGHTVVSDSELASLRQANNAYLSLKNKIPVGVNENDLPTILEKGSKYDSLNTEFTGVKTKLSDTEKKLEGFSNIPKEFTVDKWNKYVQGEADNVFSEKFDKASAQVYDRVLKEDKVKISVDPRFIPQDKLEAWNPDDPKAVDSLYDILKDGYKAQLEFAQQMSQSPVNPGSGAPGMGDGTPPAGIGPKPYGNPAELDRVNEGEMRVGGFLTRR